MQNFGTPGKPVKYVRKGNSARLATGPGVVFAALAAALACVILGVGCRNAFAGTLLGAESGPPGMYAFFYEPTTADGRRFYAVITQGTGGTPGSIMLSPIDTPITAAEADGYAENAVVLHNGAAIHGIWEHSADHQKHTGGYTLYDWDGNSVATYTVTVTFTNVKTDDVDFN